MLIANILYQICNIILASVSADHPCQPITSNNKKSHLFYEESIVHWSGKHWRTSMLNGTDDFGSEGNFKPSIITEKKQYRHSILNKKSIESQYTYSWENGYDPLTRVITPIEIRNKPFLIFPWSSKKIASQVKIWRNGCVQMHLDLSTASSNRITIIMNLRAVDDTGKIWVLQWVPLEKSELNQFSDPDIQKMLPFENSNTF